MWVVFDDASRQISQSGFSCLIGERIYAGTKIDQFGRGTGNYCSKRIKQVVEDRDKLLKVYNGPCDRQMLLWLVSSRPGDVDARVVAAVGDRWEHASRHIVDLCNPEGDNIGLTAMVFWPNCLASTDDQSI